MDVWRKEHSDDAGEGGTRPVVTSIYETCEIRQPHVVLDAAADDRGVLLVVELADCKPLPRYCWRRV